MPSDHRVFHVITSLQKAAEFHELAELGTSPVPACEKCAGCKDCTFRRTRLSREDQEVVNQIEASLKVDGITGQMSGTYPWKPCVARMRSNFQQALKIQSSVEQHMVKAGTHSGFVEEVEKSIADGRVPDDQRRGDGRVARSRPLRDCLRGGKARQSVDTNESGVELGVKECGGKASP